MRVNKRDPKHEFNLQPEEHVEYFPANKTNSVMHMITETRSYGCDGTGVLYKACATRSSQRLIAKSCEFRNTAAVLGRSSDFADMLVLFLWYIQNRGSCNITTIQLSGYPEPKTLNPKPRCIQAVH